MDNVDIINITQEDFVGEIIQDEYKVLSIDIGVINMGLSLSVINKDYTFKEVLLVDNIDITSYKHSKCKYSECNLHHTKTFCDWVEHMIYENREHFDYCDIILLEKQPPKGFVVIEQLIYSKYIISTKTMNYTISDDDNDNYNYSNLINSLEEENENINQTNNKIYFNFYNRALSESQNYLLKKNKQIKIFDYLLPIGHIFDKVFKFYHPSGNWFQKLNYNKNNLIKR